MAHAKKFISAATDFNHWSVPNTVSKPFTRMILKWHRLHAFAPLHKKSPFTNSPTSSKKVCFELRSVISSSAVTALTPSLQNIKKNVSDLIKERWLISNLGVIALTETSVYGKCSSQPSLWHLWLRPQCMDSALLILRVDSSDCPNMHSWIKTLECLMPARCEECCDSYDCPNMHSRINPFRDQKR